MRVPVGQALRWRMIGHRIVQDGGVILADDVRLGVGSPWIGEACVKNVWAPPSWDLHMDGEAIFTGETLVYLITFSGGHYKFHWDQNNTTVTLALVSEGQVSGTQDGRSSTLVAGQGGIIFPGDTLEVDISPGARVVHVECPLSVLKGHSVARHPTPMVIDRQNSLAQSVREFAAGVLQADLSGPLNTFLTDQLLGEMLVGMVLTAAGIGHLEQSRRSDLYASAKALISARFMDPDLSLKPLAAMLQTPVRTLQSAFAARDEVVSRAIRDRRLTEAQRLLNGAEFAQLSVEEIAKLTGFDSAQRMRRAFDAVDLPSPGRFRQAGATGGVPNPVV